MIRLDVDQGSPEWHQARLGIPTASNFSNIITPSTLKPSSSAETYQNKLVGEWWCGKPEESFVSDAMARGTELEPIARSAYEFITNKEIEQTGVIYRDEARTVSCSPDGLCGDIGLEIKCPLSGTHVNYLLRSELPAAYLAQVQGSMFVTGLERWDFCSYHPDFPLLIIEVHACPKFQGAFAPLLEKFIEGMLEKRELLTKMLGPKNEMG